MPKVAGLNVIGVLLAAIAMFFVGYIFYGVLFLDVWMASRGYTPEMLEGQSGAWMAGGFLIELALAVGIAWAMKARNTRGLVSGALTGLVLAILFAFPARAYDFVYGANHDVGGVLVDWGHSLIGFVLAGIILSFFNE